MSSKRKNTPTKFELMTELAAVDSSYNNGLSCVDKDPDSPGSDRPQSKKQRLLQSYEQQQQAVQENNNLQQKPVGGEERQLMESIRSVLTSAHSTEDKQSKLNHMMHYLQSLKDTLGGVPENGVSSL